MKVFDLFDRLDNKSDTTDKHSEYDHELSRKDLQRAVLTWLFSDNPPKGAALDVPTRVSKFKADAAAFWSRKIPNPAESGPSRVLEPCRTMLVQCHTCRDECWGDVTKSNILNPQLEKLKTERRDLKEQIRQSEPELKDPNTLFEEYAVWHYDKSRNQRYHRIQKEIDRLEHALLEGTRFERIRSAEVADELYLAVPAGLIAVEELADGWGLLWVHDRLEFEVKRNALPRECNNVNRQHLVQNIGAAASNAVLFQNGVRVTPGKSPYLVRKPRRHNKPQFG